MPKKTGRPYKNIDKKTFEGLCRIQSTLDEMCAVFQCGDKTLENWCKREYGESFYEIFSQKRLAGHISLRRALYRKGIEQEDTKIMIFLAKNWLGMSDKQDVKLDSPLQLASGYDLSNLSEQELLNLRELLTKAKTNGQTANDSGD